MGQWLLLLLFTNTGYSNHTLTVLLHEQTRAHTNTHTPQRYDTNIFRCVQQTHIL